MTPEYNLKRVEGSQVQLLSSSFPKRKHPFILQSFRQLMTLTEETMIKSQEAEKEDEIRFNPVSPDGWG